MASGGIVDNGDQASTAPPGAIACPGDAAAAATGCSGQERARDDASGGELGIDEPVLGDCVLAIKQEEYPSIEELQNALAIVPFAAAREQATGGKEEEEAGGRDGWEAARAWLWTLPRRRNVTYEEVEEWLQSNKQSLSSEIVTMPRSHLFKFLVSQHKLMRRTEQKETLELVEPPTPRFKRSDKWKPVYAWLESLDSSCVVGAKVIDAWLSRNPAIKEDLLGKHTRHHLFHYIQKCHTNILKKRRKQILNGPLTVNDEKKKKRKKKRSCKAQNVELQAAQVDGSMIKRLDATTFGNSSDVYKGTKVDNVLYENSNVLLHSNGESTRNNLENLQPLLHEHKGGDAILPLEDKKTGMIFMHREEARRRYEILSELRTQLLDQIVQTRKQMKIASAQVNVPFSDRPSTSAAPFTIDTNRPGSSGAVLGSLVDGQSMSNEEFEGRSRRRSRDSARLQQENTGSSLLGQRSRSFTDLTSGKKRRKGKEKYDNVVLSWSSSEVLTGMSSSTRHQYERHVEKGPSVASNIDSEKATTSQSSSNESQKPKVACSPIRCLQERERGAGIGSLASPFQMIGRRRCYRWKSFLQGWDSLERQFEGCAVWLQRKAFSSWLPCWSAYTSSVAVAAPLGMIDQGVQKVLDVRFHPHNLPQLVCSSNAAPNELLRYDLLSGRATELAGHNCQIQAVEYAANGRCIVSCGSNLVKIWDSNTGACLHTFGPGQGDEYANGHRKKINAMAVNHSQSYLVATSGGSGDSQLLLWNVDRGELACDLNISIRKQYAILPCMDALEFCDQNLLICGSDSTSGGPAIIQIWDIHAPQTATSFPAHDSYITSLKVDPAGRTIVSGAGDGSVALFDLRTCGGIARLPLGSSYEVTSVSFSSCGTYFQASSTANRTMVWDTRMLLMEPGPRLTENPLELADSLSRKTRALHCLSHGTPMPTSENAGQMPGFVDEGDQGVNDARWFHDTAVLVTCSGNGSIAMWDMSLGNPCIRHLNSHTRCVNTVAISRNDKHICSGGDDQKVVLYQNTKDKYTSGWRLTHPLLEEPPNV